MTWCVQKYNREYVLDRLRAYPGEPHELIVVDGRREVARVPYGMIRTLDKADALAHLIAAAPDLLEACKAMWLFADCCEHPASRQAFRLASAANRKAEGGEA